MRQRDLQERRFAVAAAVAERLDHVPQDPA
jgi:hypothetical protein